MLVILISLPGVFVVGFDACFAGLGEFYGFCGSKSSRFCRENVKVCEICNIFSFNLINCD